MNSWWQKKFGNKSADSSLKIKNNYGLLSAVYFYSKCYFITILLYKEGPFGREVELDKYSDIIELGVDKGEETGNLSSSHYKEVPGYVFFSCSFSPDQACFVSHKAIF